MQYRTTFTGRTPSRKGELVDLIAPHVSDTKTFLHSLTKQQLRDMLKRIKQEALTNIMRQPLDLSNLKAQISDKITEE